ncbi:hypothetical protein Tco_1379804, partial [Tanacetum coccineum]
MGSTTNISKWRLLYDGGKGIAEALNEIVCVGDDCRGLADVNEGTNLQVLTFTGMDPSYSLPVNVALLTLL